MTNTKKREKILKKILEKAENSSLTKDFFTYLAELFSHTSIGTQYYTFEGSDSEFKLFLGEKQKRASSFLIYRPRIWVKRDNGGFGYLKIEPSGLIYHRGKYSLLLCSSKVSLSYEFFGEFLFNSLCLKEYLSLEFQELVVFWLNRKKELRYSLSLPLLKKEKTDMPQKRINIALALNLKETEYSESIFSELCSEEEYQSLSGAEIMKSTDSWSKGEFDTKRKITDSLLKMKSNFWIRLEEIEKISLLIQDKVPEDLNSLSEWDANVRWGELLSPASLYHNFSLSSQIKLFSTEGKIYKKALTFFSPRFFTPLLSSSLVRKKEIFELSESLRNHTKFCNIQNLSFEFFLSFAFNSFFFKETANFDIQKINSSIFSQEGWKRLQEELLEIRWKVYYDFESYSDVITQLSFQVYRKDKLHYKKDLILDSLEELDIFEEKILLELSAPLELALKEQSGEKWAPDTTDVELLKDKIVYIAFNKSFEAEWLKKLGRKIESSHLSNMAVLIKDLTIDLSDWFKFSKNLSLNIIGRLYGAHSLKKVSDLVIEDISHSEIVAKTNKSFYTTPKKYADLEIIRDGRCAQLLYFYYYLQDFLFEGREAQNKNLSAKQWVVKKTKDTSSYLKEGLKEYCSCDVENMVLALNWLKSNYMANQEYLVPQRKILDFISWFKKLHPEDMGRLTERYLNWVLN